MLSSCTQKINEKLDLTQEEETDSAKRFKNDTYCFCCAGLLEIEREDDEINKVAGETAFRPFN